MSLFSICRLRNHLPQGPRPRRAGSPPQAPGPESAEKAGIGYEALLQRVINLGLQWRPETVPPGA